MTCGPKRKQPSICPGTNHPLAASKFRNRADQGLRLSGHSCQYNAVLAVLSTALGDCQSGNRPGNPKVSQRSKPFPVLDLRIFHDSIPICGYSERLGRRPISAILVRGRSESPSVCLPVRCGTRAGGRLLVLSDAGLNEAMQ